MYVLDTKMLVVYVLSVFEKRPKNVLKTFQGDTGSVTHLGYPLDVNLIVIHEISL